MPSWIPEWWAKWVFGLIGAAISGIVAALVAQFRSRSTKAKLGEVEASIAALEQRLSCVEVAFRASTYDRLYYLHGKFMKQGWISIPDFENVEGIYQGYHGLGGNGVGTKLYEDLHKLPNFEPM